MSLGKETRSFIMTCSTFVNPESSITHTRLPQMKASPLIRLYFDILSNKILKRDLPNWTSPFHYCKSDNYSSTAACAAAIFSDFIRVYPTCCKLFGNISKKLLRHFANPSLYIIRYRGMIFNYFLIGKFFGVFKITWAILWRYCSVTILFMKS